MRKLLYIALLLPTYLLLLLSCTGKSISFGADELVWTGFTWFSADLGDGIREKAGMLLPVTIDGHADGKLWMQLDTGIYSSVFYEGPFQGVSIDAYQTLKTDNGRPLAVQFDGYIGDLPITRAQFVVKLNYGNTVEKLEGDVKIGSIGLDIFMGKILVLDFPSQRLAVLNPKEKLPLMISQADFIPASLVKGWFVVNGSAGYRNLKLVYDTGSSSFPLWVDPLLWQQLTNLDPIDPTLQRFAASSWGNMITFVGAPIKDHIRLGNYEFSHPKAYFADGDMGTPFASIDGIMGNAMFYDQYIVILDMKDMRFGVVESK